MRTLLSRLLDVILRRRREDRLSAEVQAHLDLLTDEHMARGLSVEEARLAARKAFGGVDQMKERYRDQRGLPFFDTLTQDVRFAIRLMRRNRAFSLTAAGSLALSIGALTMAFSIVHAFVFKPLPIADPGNVYYLGPGTWSYPDYRDLRERIDTEIAGYRIALMSVGLQPESEIFWGYLVTGNYFPALGITPAAGRFITPADDRAPGASPYAVLSFEAWQRRFGGRQDVVGRELTINGRAFTILGVAPQGFHGTEVFYRPDIFVPITMQAEIEARNSWLNTRQTMNLMAFARLKPGEDKDAAEARLRTVVTELSAEHPRNGQLQVRLARPGLFGDMLGAPARNFAWGIFALGVLLMLAGCSNLAGLLLARGNDRAREIVLRTAIGAGRGRIARQLLTESIMLALTGGLGGAAIAWLGTRAVSAWRLPGELPSQIDFTADATIVLFAVIASIAVGILVGIAPARFATRLDLNQSLKGHAGYGIGRRRFQGREVLVAVQVALCVVLLHASFLAVRGLQRASTAALGWNPDGLVMAAAELGLGGLERARFDAYHAQVLREARALPGIQSAALGNSMPLYQDQSHTTLYPLPVEEPEEGRGATFYSVSPGYFATLEIPWKAGRDFTDFDRADTEPVAVINAVLAERLFGQGNALGRQFKNGRGGTPITVVGIVETGKYVGLAENPRGAMFRPLAQNYANSSMLIARSNGTVTTDDLRRVLLAFDPNLPIRTSATAEQLTALPLLPYRAAVVALGLLGLIGSGLLLSGLHAMLAYAVARRQKEIGIRVALGANGASVIRTVLTRVFAILAIGAVIGALIATGTGPLVSSLVLGVSPREPALLVAIVSLLAVIALVSSAGPVRRSLGVDPLRALREE